MKPLSTISREDQVDLGDPVSLPVQEYPHERSHITHVPALTYWFVTSSKRLA